MSERIHAPLSRLANLMTDRIMDFFAYNVDTGDFHVHKTSSTSDQPHAANIDGFHDLCAERI